MFVENAEQIKRLKDFCETLEPQVRIDLLNQFYKHVLDCIMGELLDGNLERAQKYTKLLEIPGLKPEKIKKKRVSSTTN